MKEQNTNSVPIGEPALLGLASPSALRTDRIRELNDYLRRTGRGGMVLLSCGVAAMDVPTVRHLFDRIADFEDFSADDDPHGRRAAGHDRRGDALCTPQAPATGAEAYPNGAGTDHAAFDGSHCIGAGTWLWPEAGVTSYGDHWRLKRLPRRAEPPSGRGPIFSRRVSCCISSALHPSSS